MAGCPIDLYGDLRNVGPDGTDPVPTTKENVMNLMRWEPFRESDEFFRALSRPIFDRWPSTSSENGGQRPDWLPAVDISETDDEYLLKADLPGLKREDVKVTLENNVLTVEGERKHESEAKGEKTHRVERFYGGFCRRFTLPENTDPESIRAECRDGMLNVHIPKRETRAEKPKEIEVK
jgi:HSP20 family protein